MGRGRSSSTEYPWSFPESKPSVAFNQYLHSQKRGGSYTTCSGSWAFSICKLLWFTRILRYPFPSARLRLERTTFPWPQEYPCSHVTVVPWSFLERHAWILWKRDWRPRRLGWNLFSTVTILLHIQCKYSLCARCSRSFGGSRPIPDGHG